MKINDVFWTFQGEGQYAGHRALFVRMPYCNLKCSWCDTEFNSSTEWDDEKFLELAKSETCRFAVITGGEPMMNKQTPQVIKLLKSLGFQIATETNGTFPIVDGIDFVTCSPKRDAKFEVNSEAWDKVDEFKYVIDKGFDFNVLTRHQGKNRARLSLSPEFNNFAESLVVIENYIKENPQWKVSLQTHKWMNIK